MNDKQEPWPLIIFTTAGSNGDGGMFCGLNDILLWLINSGQSKLAEELSGRAKLAYEDISKKYERLKINDL